MAVLKIDSINYMSAGSKGVTLNLDCSTVPTAPGAVSEATPNRTFVLENKNRMTLSNEDETEGSFKNSSNVNVSPLYDIVDLAVKCGSRKPNRFARHVDHSRNSEIDLEDGRVDIFSARKEESPIGFSNFSDGNCYVLTKPTSNKPRVKRTTLENNIATRNLDDRYSYEVTDLGSHVILYPTEAELGRTREDTISTKGPDPLFESAVDISGIKSNFIETIDQNAECHPFENGDVYGSVHKAKNAYDSSYSMKMPDGNSIESCRDYCGIGSCGSKLYLKYYDNRKYSFTETGSVDGSTVKKMANEEPVDGFPFQKVEVLDEMSYMGGESKHKSNLFSVRIRNTGLGGRRIGMSESTKEMLRKDIANTVRTLTEQTCPANTTLFDVYFED